MRQWRSIFIFFFASSAPLRLFFFSLRLCGEQASEFLVAPVAEWLITSVLAAAQPDFRCFGNFKLDRLELCALVRAVAERLVL